MSFTENFLRSIGKVILTVGLAIGSVFVPSQTHQASFGSNVTQLPNVIANYSDSLASPIGATDTSMTLVSGQDSLARNLSGFFCFTIDAQTSIAEFVCGTVSGTAVTSMTRGIDPLNPNTNSVAALEFVHRRGASVQITDYTTLGYLTRILSGTDTVPGVLQYKSGTTDASIQANNQNLVNYSLLSNTAIAGATNADTTHKGIAQESTQAQILSKTQTGSTGADLFVNPSTLYDTLLSDYKVDTGSANAYAIAPSPAITAYTVGQIFSFKAANANTTTSTLNVNSLGTKTIKNSQGNNLNANDIISGQIIAVEYDGINFQMLNISGNGYTDLATAQTVAGLKTFSTLPQSSATPSSSSDLTTKTYVDSTVQRLIAQSTTATGGSSTADTSEHTLLTTAIPGNLLGTGNVIRENMYGTWGNGTAGTNLTIRVKYGGTQIWSYVVPAGGNANGNFQATFYVYATGSTATQQGEGTLMYVTAANAFTYFTTGTVATSAIDSTSSQNLILTTQVASTTNPSTINVTNYTVEILK
jgi:hypothetical protein